ncbi:MAG: alpha/beta hydrolase [Candidatus Saccharimonadales bacterium]
MEYLITEPASGIVRDPKRMVVIAPGFRDSMHTYLGRKAAAVANRTGFRVVTYDSPGTGTNILTGAERKAVSADPVANAGRVGRSLARILETEGAASAVMAGNSRGATETVTVAATETVPVESVTTMDLVGLVAVTGAGGFWRYGSYQGLERLRARWLQRLNPKDPDEPIDTAGLPPMASQMDEISTHIGLACSDIPLRSLVYLATDMPDVTVNAVAAGYTFAAPNDYQQLLKTSLPALRAPGETPFEYNIEPGTWHSSFEDLSRFSGHVAATVTMTDQYYAAQRGAI